MLSVPSIIVVTVLAQAFATDTFFREKEEAIVYTYRAEMEQKTQISQVPVAASFASFVDYEKATFAEDRQRCNELERRGDVF